MGVINSMDDIVRALTDGSAQHPAFSFDNRIGDVAGPVASSGNITSFWRLNKTNGANGKAPDGVTYPNGVCTRATLGAVPFKDATPGRQLYLLGMEGALYCSGTMIMYDRLAHAGTFPANTNAEQIVNLTASRNAETGEGNEIWVEIYTQIGATLTTMSAVYINQDGVQKTTPLAQIGGSGQREEGRILKLALADGDTGVKGVVSIKLTAASGTGTAGAYGVVLARPLLIAICETGGASFYRDTLGGIPSLPTIDPDACLAFNFHSAGGGSLRGTTILHMIEV